MTILRVESGPGVPDIPTGAVERLRQGGLVAFPTETVYGLGADATNPQAVRRIFTAKGRPAHNPLIVHLAEPSDAPNWTADWPEVAARLAAKFWPGPLTLIAPHNGRFPTEVTAGGSTAALRVPAHPVARELIRQAGIPVAAPSANRSGGISPTTAAHVWNSLGDRVDIILDGGPSWAGIESTVLDVTGDRMRMLRPGPIGREELTAFLGIDIELGSRHDGALRSPGMLDRHYAPTTPLVLVSGRAELEASRGPDVAIVSFGPMAGADEQMPVEAAEYAAKLYEVLHRLDAGRFARISWEAPPEGEAWRAVRDRLTRATKQEPNA